MLTLLQGTATSPIPSLTYGSNLTNAYIQIAQILKRATASPAPAAPLPPVPAHRVPPVTPHAPEQRVPFVTPPAAQPTVPQHHLHQLLTNSRPLSPAKLPLMAHPAHQVGAAHDSPTDAAPDSQAVMPLVHLLKLPPASATPTTLQLSSLPLQQQENKAPLRNSFMAPKHQFGNEVLPTNGDAS
jgi:hypothetical protein